MAEELEEYEVTQSGMTFTVQLTPSTAKRMGLSKPAVEEAAVEEAAVEEAEQPATKKTTPRKATTAKKEQEPEEELV